MARSYTIQHSSQYMENHRAALPLAAQSALAVAKTKVEGEMVFSINEAGSFQVTVGADGSQTGWSSHELGGDFAKIYSGQTAAPTAFAVSQDEDTGNLTVVIAYTVGAAGEGADEIWYLDGLSNDPQATWLDPSTPRGWARIPFDFSSPALPHLLPTTLNIADLRITAALNGTVPVAVATVVNPSNQHELPFFVTLSPRPGTPAWSLLNPPQDYTATLDMAVGRPEGSLLDGLYLLYSYNQETSLSFQPRNAEFPPVVFAPPGGASAMCAVPAYDAGGTATGFTDLLVAGNGTLTLYSYDEAENAQNQIGLPPPVLSAGVIQGVTALHAAVDGGVIAVWGINGEGKLFYTQAAYADRSNPGAWSMPLALLSGVLHGAPFLTETRMISALFGVTGGQDGESLFVLHKDPVTNGGATTWTQRQVHLPAPDQVVTLQTYTTRLMVLDESGLPVPGAKVGLTAASSAVVEIGGVMVTLVPGNTQTFSTDASGTITIVHEVSSLSAPAYTPSIDGQTFDPIDPTAGVRARLSGIKQGSDLLPVVDSKRQLSSTELNQAASGIQQATSLNVSPGQGAGTAPATFAFAAQAGVENGVFSFISDVVQALVNDVESFVLATVQEVEGGWALFVTIGEETFQAVIQTAEDILHAVYGILRSLWIDIETAFRWLAFLFDWDDILEVQGDLIDLYNQIFQAVPDAVGALQGVIDGWMKSLENWLSDGASRQSALASIPAQPASAQIAARQPSYQTQDGSDLRTDPRIGWAQSKLQLSAAAPASSGALAVSPAVFPSVADADPLQPFVDALQALGEQFENAFQRIAADTENLIHGTVDPGPWLIEVAGTLASLGLEAVQDVIDAVLTCIAELIEEGLEGLNATIDIPLLSPLFRLVSGGKDLTLLSFAALVQAVVITIGYKIATGNDPKALLTQETIQGIGTAISQLGSRLPQAPVEDAFMEIASSQSTAAAPVKQPVQPAGSVLAAAASAPDTHVLVQIRGGMQLVAGAVIAATSFTLPVPGNAGEEQDGGKLENLLFGLEFLLRTCIAATEVVQTAEEGAGDGFEDASACWILVPANTLMYSVVAALMVGLNQQGSGSRLDALNALQKVDPYISSFVGGLQLVGRDMIEKKCSDAAAILADSAEVGALAQTVLRENPWALLAVVMLRTVATLAAGGVNLGEGGK